MKDCKHVNLKCMDCLRDMDLVPPVIPGMEAVLKIKQLELRLERYGRLAGIFRRQRDREAALLRSFDDEGS